jgi:hypothetical protein
MSGSGKAPRFTQKPSIQQTPTGDLLMECQLEASPKPQIRWQHGTDSISAGGRVQLRLEAAAADMFKAILIIKEPTANDGGAYKCTASNELGESNANINLNFAGADDQQKVAKGPTFVGKPRIIPKDGGALIVMECRVKSNTRPTSSWYKDGVSLTLGAVFNALFTDEGDQTYLCQLEIRNPSATDAGQYRCNIRNDQGETNANLTLNFEQEAPQEKRERSEKPEDKAEGRMSKEPSPKRKDVRSKEPSPKRGTTPKRDAATKRESTPKRDAAAATKKEATPTRTAVPDDIPSPATSRRSSTKSEKMDDASQSGASKRTATALGVDDSKKKARSRSPSPAAAKSTRDNFKKAPVIIEHLKSKEVAIGDRIILECQMQCHTSTKITWSHNGVTIKDSSTVTSSFDGEYARLTISRLVDHMAGLYKCTATSDFGEAQSSAMLNFEAKDEDVEEDQLRDLMTKEKEEAEQRKREKDEKAKRDDVQKVPDDKSAAAKKTDTKPASSDQRVPDQRGEGASDEVCVCLNGMNDYLSARE